MENTQFIAERIKIQAKAKGLSVKKLLERCGLGVNTVNKMSNGTDIVSQNLIKIAEELECSVDYLCGRTDNPLIGENYISTGDITGDHNANMNVGYLPKETASATDQFIAEFIRRFEKLDFDDKLEIMNITAQKLKQSA